MGLVLLALFVSVSLVEIIVFIEVGGIIGAWQTVALVILTAALGSWMIRKQGLATLRHVQEELEAGRIATHELFNGFCLLVAGVLMLTPGFITDAIGFLLLLPAFRNLIWSQAGGYYTKKYSRKRQTKSQASFRFQNDFETPSEDDSWQKPIRNGHWSQDKTVIDGDFVDVTPKEDNQPEDDELKEL